jgi:hypothetical protein
LKVFRLDQRQHPEKVAASDAALAAVNLLPDPSYSGRNYAIAPTSNPAN